MCRHIIQEITWHNVITLLFPNSCVQLFETQTDRYPLGLDLLYAVQWGVVPIM